MTSYSDLPIDPRPTVYVLTLKTWKEYDRAHHWYGRIHYAFAGAFVSLDSESLPDEDGVTTIRHGSREEAIAGARRFFDVVKKSGDSLVIGVWGLDGWQADEPFEVLERAP